MICAKSEVLPVVPRSSYQLVAGLHVRVGSEVVKLSAECDLRTSMIRSSTFSILNTNIILFPHGKKDNNIVTLISVPPYFVFIDTNHPPTLLVVVIYGTDSAKLSHRLS